MCVGGGGRGEGKVKEMDGERWMEGQGERRREEGRR